MSDLRPIRIALSELRHVHDAIIDNTDFNLTVAAKRNLRELCAWVETYGARDDEIERLTTDLKAERKQRAYERRIYTARVDELEAALDAESRNRVRIAQWLLEQEKEIERLEQANARLTNFMHRVQDAVKGFELIDSKEQTAEQGDT